MVRIPLFLLFFCTCFLHRCCFMAQEEKASEQQGVKFSVQPSKHKVFTLQRRKNSYQTSSGDDSLSIHCQTVLMGMFGISCCVKKSVDAKKPTTGDVENYDTNPSFLLCYTAVSLSFARLQHHLPGGNFLENPAVIMEDRYIILFESFRPSHPIISI